MRFFADLHIHSKYSRATSNTLDIPNLEKYARIKGVNLLGTGDFTHPLWIKELKESLVEEGNGILKTKTGFSFILQAEISLIYSQDKKGRRIHNIVLAPNFEVVGQIIEYLKKHGRLDYDGRPIFKIPCDEFVYELKKINDSIEIIPAHIWTPWFSLFGSMSGFDSVEECFKDQAKHIHALETGLSSDPAMNWRLSALDKYALVSFSDLHSYWPWRIGREATIFELKELTYKALINSLKTKQDLIGTIEFFPEECKYHFDGHRACNVCMKPSDSINAKNICPKCKRPLTIGVAHRVEELADRPEGFKLENAAPFKNLIPLSELLSGLLKSAVATKKVWAEYNNLINAFGNEINILLNTPIEELNKVAGEKIAHLIIKNRQGKIKVKPGYDGVYGKLILDDEMIDEMIDDKLNKGPKKDKELKKVQLGLGDFC